MIVDKTAALPEKIAHTVSILKRIASDYSPAALANSFGVEDMVLTDLIAKHALGIEVFSLDTGRLPEETYQVMQEARAKYALPLRVHFPRADALEALVRENGPNGFYDSVENRKACCHVRKVEPLRRALQGKQAWITGLRRQQSVTRTGLAEQEWDDGNGLEKFNPLLEWTTEEIWRYVKDNEVPYNALHDRGYPSIGCAPCTRAITVGEDIRAGRWWWENPETKECGLHVRKHG